MSGRGLVARRTRRQAAQALAAAAGGFLLVRVGVDEARLALAQDDDSSGHGQGGGHGGDSDDERGDDGDTEEEAVVPAAEIAPGSASVRIVSDEAGGFVPGELTIDAGQTVTFVNMHSDEHTATGAGFDTGIIPEGSTATVVLDEPGTYFYACQIHPVMTGSILVRGSDGAVPQQAAAQAATPAAGTQAAQVSIANMAFNPADITVQTGTSVTWSNDDSLPHTVTALDGSFDSGILDPGASFSWTFAAPAEIAYQCQLHPIMQGSVTVEGDAVAAASPAAGTAAEPSAPSLDGSLEGVWLVEFAPDDPAQLAPHEALLTFHPDGLLQADFAVMTDGALPDTMLSAGHGQWQAEGEGVAISLQVLLVDDAGRFAGTATIDGQGQPSADGQVLDGTFSLAQASQDGDMIGEANGTMRGAPATLGLP